MCFSFGVPAESIFGGAFIRVPAESIFGGAFIRGPRRKYFRWGRSASNCVKAPSAQGSPRKIRKDFAWGKFSGSPPKVFSVGLSFGVPAESIFGGADRRVTASKLLPRRGPRGKSVRILRGVNFRGPRRISAGNLVGYYFSGSPPNFRRKFGGVNFRGPRRISAGNFVGYYFSGSPQQFPQEILWGITPARRLSR